MLTTVWIALLVFTVPGLVVSWISGLKLPWAAAASIPVSFGIYGMAAWELGMWDMRFDVRSATIARSLLPPAVTGSTASAARSTSSTGQRWASHAEGHERSQEVPARGPAGPVSTRARWLHRRRWAILDI